MRMRQTARQEHSLTCAPPLPTHLAVAMITLLPSCQIRVDANLVWKARPRPALAVFPSFPMTLRIHPSTLSPSAMLCSP